jgi:hypothetical protein
MKVSRITASFLSTKRGWQAARKKSPTQMNENERNEYREWKTWRVSNVVRPRIETMNLPLKTIGPLGHRTDAGHPSARQRLGVRRRSLRSRRFWAELAVSTARLGILSAAGAKAVTSRTPSPQSKTWRQIRRLMGSFDLQLWTRIGAMNLPNEFALVPRFSPSSSIFWRRGGFEDEDEHGST